MPSCFSPADARGAARLATDAVTGVTDLVEEVHATVARPFSRSRRTRGITGLVYRSVRGVTRRVGHAVDTASRAAEALYAPGAASTESAAREALVAVLNGVLGDRLAARQNPLATPMQFRHAGRPQPLDADSPARAIPEASATLLVQVHGLCMHDGQWRSTDHDPGAELADELGATLLKVRYNSGRPISQNGRDFAVTLNALVTAWPRPVERIVVVGHSMGGLVARSAFHHAGESGHRWPSLDAALVTLGTPHHGAPLERLGSHIDALLGATRYSAPFARISKIRSAGITDLRHGRVIDEGGAGRDRFARAADAGRRLPLPEGVACYFVAAAATQPRADLRDQTLGDGLVPVHSALGRHSDPARTLRVPVHRQWVARGMNHFDLLRRPEVTARVLDWLG